MFFYLNVESLVFIWDIIVNHLKHKFICSKLGRSNSKETEATGRLTFFCSYKMEFLRYGHDSDLQNHFIFVILY